ncbi:uncharacterized protein LTR77_007426 [Saxophila tyrrhenica]|uniref:Oxidoreductase n=1 Tax=Saxophila tyrrhenica TaxID=1690608 RepID=A0AAV9P562_9PEZI|nr:hypothetical protein LTR77_007426 [Saxophila tyrrhenica]
MSDPTGVSIIGSGIFVKEQHLPAVLACPSLSLKAIYSRSLASAKSVSSSLSNPVDLYSDDSEKSYKDVLSRPDVQAVIIALPILVQPDFIKQALSAGKHVLAEKPLAPDVKAGKELVDWYHKNVDDKKVNFSVAEQFRYYAAYQHAAKQVSQLGKVQGVKVRMHTCIQKGMKYIETEWRKKPQHQGGFLLDGGVHFIAGMRVVLGGGGVKVDRLSANTALLQDYLPPVDTVDATLRLDNGSTGSFAVSFGTSFEGAEWTVACEKGTVSVDRTIVKTKPKGGEEKVEDVKDEVGGTANQEHVPIGSVMPEVFAWAKSLKEGKWDAKQSAEEGLADLEILEALLKSGEKHGEPVTLKYQV